MQLSTRVSAAAKTPRLPSAHPVRGVRWPTSLVLGGLLVCVMVVTSMLAGLLAPADPAAIDLGRGLQPPSTTAWLGTDQLGRDLLSRVLWAGQVSLLLTGFVLLVSLLAGLLVGMLAGYGGQLLDDLLMRLVDAALALPTLIVALAVIGTLGAGSGALAVALSVTHWALYARLVRGQVLTLRSAGYVLAAEALGATRAAIMRRHLLPAVLGPLAVRLSLDAGGIVLLIGSLSFLGLGVPPPQPEWGAMLVEARPFLGYAPHVALAPGLALLLTVFGCILLGEGLAARLRLGTIPSAGN